MATAQQIKNYEKKWINPKREGLMSDLPLAEQKAIRKRSASVERRYKINRAKMATKSFFDRYTTEVTVGALVVVGGFFWMLHKKKTTGTIPRPNHATSRVRIPETRYPVTPTALVIEK